MAQSKYSDNSSQKPLKTTIFSGILCLLGLFVFVSFQQAPDTIPGDTVPQAIESGGLSSDTIPGDIIEGDTMAGDTVAGDTVGQPTETQEQAPAPRTFTKGQYTRDDLRKGQRMFKGMVAFASGIHDCSSCHYTSRSDTLNWNPSAYDLAVVWKETKDYSIKTILDQQVGRRMVADHPGMAITEAEEHQLEAYYEFVLDRGPGELRPIPVNGIIFWGVGFLMLLALVDLIFTRKIKFKVLHVMIIIVGLMVHMQYAMAEARGMSRTQGYAPDQPIKFSHRIHSGENEIDCNYCHHINSFSQNAGIPSNNTCLNCHNVVREGTNSGRFEINKIHRAELSGQPVRWIRIHKLPDHSAFSHAQHVNAGRLDCAECHGEVELMDIIEQVEPLSMGWCLTCHRDTEVDFLGNPYYQIYEQLHQDIIDGKIDRVTAAQLGGEDCYVCHH